MNDVDVGRLSDNELVAYNAILNDPIKWINTFLVNPESEDGESLVLNEMQERLLTGLTDRNVFRCHRRMGKTFCLIGYCLWAIMNNPAFQVLALFPDKAKVSDFFDKFDSIVGASPIFNGALTASNNSNNPVVRKFTNGSYIRGFTLGSTSKKQAQVIRSQGADLVIIDEAAFLDEKDWTAIEPIMIGDAHRGRVITFVSSTPTAARGRYYYYCCGDMSEVEEHLKWRQVYIPVTANPSYAGKLGAIRATTTEADFRQEWMAEFPDIDDATVYRRSYIDRAKREYDYFSMRNAGSIPRDAIRTMGVDWDKYGGTGPNIFILELDTKEQVYKAVYHEEIEPSTYCLTRAVERIIQLNQIFRPAWIYVDRGMGEGQIESLHQYGSLNPSSRLVDIVKGIHFGDSVETVDPITTEKTRRPLKPVMVTITVKMFEDGLFRFPASHTQFTHQLENFKVRNRTANTVSYVDGDDHIISAFMLAAWAMHQNFTDPFRITPATSIVNLPVPEVVMQDEPSAFKGYGIIPEYMGVSRKSIGERKLPSLSAVGFDGQPLFTRSKF